MSIAEALGAELESSDKSNLTAFVPDRQKLLNFVNLGGLSVSSKLFMAFLYRGSLYD